MPTHHPDLATSAYLSAADPRVADSSEAVEFDDVGPRLLVMSTPGPHLEVHEVRPLLGGNRVVWRSFLATFTTHVLVIGGLAVATNKGWILAQDPAGLWLFYIAFTILGLAFVAGLTCLFRARALEIGIGLMLGSALVVLLFYGYGLGSIILLGVFG